MIGNFPSKFEKRFPTVEEFKIGQVVTKIWLLLIAVYGLYETYNAYKEFYKQTQELKKELKIPEEEEVAEEKVDEEKLAEEKVTEKEVAEEEASVVQRLQK